MRLIFRQIALAVFALTFATGALAQAFPMKPVRIVVPYAPGGGIDLVARPVAQRLSVQLGQPVVVENRPGASGIVGAEVVAKSAGDGYTLLVTGASHYLQPFVTRNIPYDTRNDFVPVAPIARAPILIVVNSAAPIRSIDELVEQSKQRVGGLPYVTAGPNSSQHLAALLLAGMTGAKLEHVAYKGGSPALSDLVSGEVPMGVLVMGTVWPQVKTGKLRPIAFVERAGSRNAPDVPVVGDRVKGYAMPDLWVGALASRGTPAAIAQRLNDEIQQAAATPEVRERLEAIGYEVMPAQSVAMFTTTVNEALSVYQRITSDAGIKPE